jgi:hypothetical protein
MRFIPVKQMGFGEAKIVKVTSYTSGIDVEAG